MPGWPNSQLPIRNLLSYEAQTWRLLVFILKTPSGQIFSKISQSALFSLRHPKNFENENFFFCLKIAKIDMGGQFWLEKNDSGHKNPFFKR